MNKFNSQKGLTIMELLVATVISLFVLAGIMTQYSGSVASSYDQNIRMTANLQAQAILQTIGSEIRILGNGVPFDQPNFQIGEDTLSDPTVADPIQISTATANSITFRLNETGEVALLSANFNPATSLSISLTSVAGLADGDPVYISNSVVAGEDALYGVIDTVDSTTNTITLEAGYVASPSSTFDMGSILEEVPLITFNSPNDGSGITRDSGFGEVIMGEGSTMTLDYLDVNGNSITLPLTNEIVLNNLRAIRVTVSLTASTPLSDGSTYTANAVQVFGLRNLTYVF
jgi:type II secretory pathway pseudopilin PulG